MTNRSKLSIACFVTQSLNLGSVSSTTFPITANQTQKLPVCLRAKLKCCDMCLHAYRLGSPVLGCAELVFVKRLSDA